MVGVIIDAVDTVGHIPAGNVHLAADNGLDICCLGGFIEIDTAVHNTVVGDGDGILTKLLHPVHDAADPAGTVQEAVFRMHM